MANIELGMFQTLALAVLVIYLGSFFRQKFPTLVNFCIPASVVGGTIVSILTCVLYMNNIVEFSFDTSINSFFYNIFFATGGASASLLLLKKGGKLLVIFAVLATVLALCQNLIAVGVGTALGLEPLMALMLGSTPLTGGHGSAASFGPIAEAAGAVGAEGMAITAATFGLVAGCVMGGPLGRRLVEKHKLLDSGKSNSGDALNLAAVDEGPDRVRGPIDAERSTRACFYMILACGLGQTLFLMLDKVLPDDFALPIHVLCLVSGIIVRLALDLSKKGDEDLYENIAIVGEISLALFISTSIMTMKLWQLIDLMGTMAIVLGIQLLFMFLFCSFITYNMCGKNYDAAVIASGHCGFSLGATAVAMASMTSVCQKYRYSKLAFFIVPLVGGFLGDISNAFLVNFFINALK